MSKVDVAEVEHLVTELVEADEWSMPVRTMEELIAAGDAAVELLSELVSDVRDYDYRHAQVWAAIVLGQLRAGSGRAGTCGGDRARSAKRGDISRSGR